MVSSCRKWSVNAMYIAELEVGGGRCVQGKREESGRSEAWAWSRCSDRHTTHSGWWGGGGDDDVDDEDDDGKARG